MRRMCRRTSFKMLLVAACGLILLVGSRLASETRLNLRFGVYTSEKPADLQKKLKPALNHLERALAGKLSRPVRIRLRIFKSYDMARKALTQGYVDFSRFGPASFILATASRPMKSPLSSLQIQPSPAAMGFV